MNARNLILGIIISTFLGCETEQVEPARLFVKEMGDPTYYKDAFEYENNHLVSFKRFFGSREETNTQFVYLNNQLVKVNVKRDQGLEYTIELVNGENGLRSEEKLTMISNGDTTYIRLGKFVYDKKVLKSIKYTYPYNDPADYASTELDFEWTDGNITRINRYFYDNTGERHDNGYNIFVYDDKINYSNRDVAFVYTIPTPDETILSKNNLITYGNETDIKTESYVYTYNDTGYPIQYLFKGYGPVIIRYE
jgi:hypothetical protein